MGIEAILVSKATRDEHCKELDPIHPDYKVVASWFDDILRRDPILAGQIGKASDYAKEHFGYEDGLQSAIALALVGMVNLLERQAAKHGRELRQISPQTWMRIEHEKEKPIRWQWIQDLCMNKELLIHIHDLLTNGDAEEHMQALQLAAGIYRGIALEYQEHYLLN